MYVLAEYVWLDAADCFRSKIQVMNIPASWEAQHLSIEAFQRWNYDGSSTGQATGSDSEITLVPVYAAYLSVPASVAKVPRWIVLCETRDGNDVPLPNNYYGWAREVFDLPAVKESRPWFGLEQEYFIIDPTSGLPLGMNSAVTQGQYYCSVGTGNAYGRKVVMDHLERCLSARLTVSGINAEVAPGQWEFQIGPVEGIEAAHQLLVARYLLIQVAEEHGYRISFEPKPVLGNWNGSGCHTNFSTFEMREGGEHGSGLKYIEETIQRQDGLPR